MDGRETGTVKAWIEERGMGFITPASGGEDRFVHRSMLTDGQSLQIGAEVSFKPEWDAQRSKPTATEVQGAMAAPAAPAGGQWSAGPAGQPWSAGPAGKGGGGWAGGKGAGGGTMGTVKAWIDARGMGFITPADGGEDLFVHRSNLVDGTSLVIGAQVSYTPGWDAMKSKAIASNVAGARAAPAENSNLFISNLPSDITEEKLWGTFGQYGTVVSIKVLPDNGSPSRVALVKMGDSQQASWLVMNVDGNIPLGLESVVGVKYANEKPGGGGGGPPKPAFVSPPAWGGAGGAGGAPPGPPAKSDNLYICGLPVDATNESVTACIGQYGTVTSVKVLPANGKPDSAALVRMSSVTEAEWIVDNLNGNMPQGLDQVLQIKYAAAKSAAPAGGGYGAAPAWGAGAKGGGPYGKGGWAPAAPAPQWAAGPPAGKKDKLLIIGLPQDSTMQSVTQVIGQYGTVKGVNFKPEGSIEVQMGDEAEAQWIVQNLDGNIPQGLTAVIAVKFAQAGPAAGPGAPAPATGGMVSGTVKHWVEDRGMGFIGPADGGEDCFVHRSNLLDGLSLVVGAQVTFQLDWDARKNKPCAQHVSGAVGGDGVGKGAAKAAGKGW